MLAEARSTTYSVAMEITVSVACGGPLGAKGVTIHLEHVGPRLQCDYQALSLTVLRSCFLCPMSCPQALSGQREKEPGIYCLCMHVITPLPMTTFLTREGSRPVPRPIENGNEASRHFLNLDFQELRA